MSAAEPAPFPAVVMNTAGGAAVIPLHDRVRRHAGRGPHMSETPETGSPESSSRELLAEHIETMFNELGHSLTEESTAETFTLTLTIVRGMLEGAVAEGIVDEGQRAELDAMLGGLFGVPGMVG